MPIQLHRPFCLWLSIGTVLTSPTLAGIGFYSPRLWSQVDDSSFYAYGPYRAATDHQGGVYLTSPYLDWVNGQLVGGPFRLREADGSVDPTFDPPLKLDRAHEVAVQSDGRVLVSKAEGNADVIWRMEKTGAIDTTFRPVAFNGFVRSLVSGPDDRILVAVLPWLDAKPAMAGVIPVTWPTVHRLLADGAIDASFSPPVVGTSLGLEYMTLYAPPLVDGFGRILIGGLFESINGKPVNNFGRLLSNGELDEAFVAANGSLSSVGVIGRVREFGFQPDGKIIVAGRFRFAPEHSTSKSELVVVRLLPEGGLDPEFGTITPPVTGLTGSLRHLQVLPHGDFALLAGGELAIFDADGTRVSGVFEDRGVNSSIFTLDDGRLLALDSDPTRGVTAILPGPWRIDPSFGTGGFGATLQGCSIVPLRGGNVLVAGGFSRVNTQTQVGLAILNAASGDLIPSQPALLQWTAGTSLNRETDDVMRIVGTSAGKVLYRARLLTPEFFGRTVIGRLTSNGELDRSFQSIDSLVDPWIDGVEGFWGLKDGRILLQSTEPAEIATGVVFKRLLADGYPDPNVVGVPAPFALDLFQGDMSSPEAATQIKLGQLRLLREIQPGRLLGSLASVNGTGRIILLDDNLHAADGFDGPALQVQQYATADEFRFLNGTVNYSDSVHYVSDELVDAQSVPEGRIVVVGDFHNLAGSRASLIARLNPNGRIDDTFNSPTLGYDASPFSPPRVLAVAADPNGRIYIAGQFDRIDGVECRGLVRLQPDGTHDPSFVSPVRFSPQPAPEARLYLDGDTLWVVGNFVDGQEKFPRPIWKLNVASNLNVIVGPVEVEEVTLLVRGPGSVNAQGGVVVQRSVDLVSWSQIATRVSNEGDTLRCVVPRETGEGKAFYQVTLKP